MKTKTLREYFERCIKEGFVNPIIKEEFNDILLNPRPFSSDSYFVSALQREDYSLNYVRNYFVQNFGWFVIYDKWIEEITSGLRELGVKNILELYAGNGWLSYALFQNGFNVKAYTLKKDSYTLTESPIKKRAVKEGILKFAESVEDFKKIEKKSNFDLLILSWIPYQYNAVEELRLMDKDKIIMFVSEGANGCISDEKTFEYLMKNFHSLKEVDNLNFPIVHDFTIIAKKMAS